MRNSNSADHRIYHWPLDGGIIKDSKMIFNFQQIININNKKISEKKSGTNKRETEMINGKFSNNYIR